MPQFTQLNLQSKSDAKSQPATTNPTFIGKQTIALFAGAVLATALLGGLLLETSGCSRENDTAVSSNIQRPITPAATSSPAPIQEAPAAVPVAKKVAKKRPAPALYADKNYGVTFTYPKRYTLKAADPAKPDATPQSAMNFVQPGGVNVVAVALPKNSYPHPDLASASFNVSVNPTLTAEQCGQFALLQPASTGQPAIVAAKVKLAGLDFKSMEAVTGPETSQSDAKYYHAFVNGACYEFALGLSTQAQVKDKDAEPKENEDPAAAVDRTAVFRRLQSILATVKIESVSAPAVAATESVTPAAQPAPTTDVAAKYVRLTTPRAAGCSPRGPFRMDTHYYPR
jgi:hypothetical protein